MSEDVSLGPRLPAGHVDSLRELTSEQAAVAMSDLFLRTGSAQAHVLDPAEVRRLIRLACRRRGVAVRTLAVKDVVVAYDEDRRAQFLETDDGHAYLKATNERIEAAMTSWLPKAGPLRVVKNPEIPAK